MKIKCDVTEYDAYIIFSTSHIINHCWTAQGHTSDKKKITLTYIHLRVNIYGGQSGFSQLNCDVENYL